MYDITKEHYGVKKWSDYLVTPFFLAEKNSPLLNLQNRSNGH